MTDQNLSDRPVTQDGILDWINRELKPVVRRLRSRLDNLHVTLTLGGDLSGTPDAATVEKIKATTITTAGGALTTGTVLRATGANAIDYGAVDLSNSSAVTNVLPAPNVARSVSAYTITDPTTLTFSTAAGTVDVNPYTVPANPTGPARCSLTMLKVRLESAITGGGTVVIRAGTSVGGNDLLVDSAAWTSATAVGTEVGVSIADLGTGFPASTGYIAELAAGASINVRATTGGGGISGGAAKVYVYGGLAA